MKIDKKLIKELKDYLDEFNLSEIEYQDGAKKIKVAKNISGITTVTSLGDKHIKQRVKRPVAEYHTVSTCDQVLIVQCQERWQCDSYSSHGKQVFLKYADAPYPPSSSA